METYFGSLQERERERDGMEDSDALGGLGGRVK